MDNYQVKLAAGEPLELHAPQSSVVREATFFPKSGIAVVEMRNGRTYRYQVSSDNFIGWLNASSVGSYYNARIRNCPRV